MPRYRITVEYDGTDLVGWQKQGFGVSVQSALETAVSAFSSEVVEVYGAGRTDAGVHATGQVAHFDLVRAWPLHTIVRAMNVHLRPHPVSVLEAVETSLAFHARFAAVRRHYRYRIINRLGPPMLDRLRAWHVIKPLDAEAMHAAAQNLVGHYDFSSFRAAECQAKSPMKTLDRLDVRRQGDEVIVEASSRSFLHNQVRAMVGTLKLVGQGRWTEADFIRARNARDRRAAGPTAPAAGLCLIGVDYVDNALDLAANTDDIEEPD